MMKTHTLERRQEIPRPLDEVFPFFAKPENLQIITPPWLSMELLTPGPIPMHVGSIVDYVMRLHGLPVRWTTAIAEYDPPYRFVDVQIRGPYSFWHHQHSFSPTKTGTLVEDCVTYALPFGPAGLFLHGLLIKNDLRRIFDYRTRALDHAFAVGAC